MSQIQSALSGRARPARRRPRPAWDVLALAALLLALLAAEAAVVLAAAPSVDPLAVVTVT